jgi:hypothetical protein
MGIRQVVNPSQAPTKRDFAKSSGSSIAVANEVAVVAPTPGIDMRIWQASLRGADARAAPGLEKGQHDWGRPLLINEERTNIFLERASLAGGDEQPEGLHAPTDLVRELDCDPDCSPFDAWVRLPVVSPYFHLIGEQPPEAGRD